MKRHCLVLPASERWEYPEDANSRLNFASPPSRVVWAWPDPLPTGLNGDGKKCTDPMVGGARSITLYDACTPSDALLSILEIFMSHHFALGARLL